MSDAVTGGVRDEPFEAPVVSSTLVHEGRVWDVRSDTVRYDDAEIVREYVDHPGAAAVVAIDDEGRMLLIQQYRHPIRHQIGNLVISFSNESIATLPLIALEEAPESGFFARIIDTIKLLFR